MFTGENIQYTGALRGIYPLDLHVRLIIRTRRKALGVRDVCEEDPRVEAKTKTKNRWPGVFKRGTGWAYRAQFWDNGQRWGISGAGYDSAREAWEARNDALKNAKPLRYRDVRPDGTLSLGEYLRLWLQDSTRNVRPATASSYESKVASICRHPLADVRLKSLTESQYRQIVSWLGEGATHGTQMAKVNVLRTALNAAVRIGLLPDNPVAHIRVARTVPRVDAQAWDQETTLRFLAHRRAARDPLYDVWYLALVTGLRRGELHGLKREDLELDNGVLHVRRQRTEVRSQIIEGPTKTEGSQAPVYIDAETCDLLRRHQWVSDYLVTNPRTSRPYDYMSTFRDHWIKACNLAGVPVLRFHDLRHTSASLLAAAGVPLIYAQKRLRHWSPEMTRRYTHVQDSYAVEVANIIGAMLQDRGTKPAA